jgi:N-carbamoylputrescine amidase
MDRDKEVLMLTVALLQMQSHGYDQAANQAKGEAFCRRAAAMGVDIALFPEMWNVGYTYHKPEGLVARAEADPVADDLWRSPEYWRASAASRLEEERGAIAELHQQAVGRDSPFVVHFQELARELGIAIALTYLEHWEPLPRNTLSLIDRHGDVVLTYAKVHTCDFDLPECALTPGEDFPVCSLDTAAGEITVGAMICYDREFPESARVLMLRGAELIVVPNASMLYPIHLDQLRLRAYENMVAVAMTNYAGTDPNGHSAAYDPIAFMGGTVRDMLVVAAGEEEGVYLAPFDLDRIREYRRRETSGNAFRRPHRYGLLTSTEVSDPFRRAGADGQWYHETRRQA